MSSITEIASPFRPRNVFEVGKTPEQIMKFREEWTEAGKELQRERQNYRMNFRTFIVMRGQELRRGRG